MRPTRHEWAMNLVQATAARATCLRRQVGCVLLNARGHVLATGYNGVASGMDHCNESKPIPIIEFYEIGLEGCLRSTFPHACPGAESPSGTNLDGCEAIHAEQNALLQCSDVYQIHTCYVSASPCVTCTKLLLNTSCQNIVFKEEYAHKVSADLWMKAGRNWLSVDCLGS